MAEPQKYYSLMAVGLDGLDEDDLPDDEKIRLLLEHAAQEVRGFNALSIPQLLNPEGKTLAMAFLINDVLTAIGDAVNRLTTPAEYMSAQTDAALDFLRRSCVPALQTEPEETRQ